MDNVDSQGRIWRTKTIKGTDASIQCVQINGQYYRRMTWGWGNLEDATSYTQEYGDKAIIEQEHEHLFTALVPVEVK